MIVDLERVRADTPAVEGQSFLNSCGSSLMPAPVVEAMVDHLRLEQEVGGYAAGDRRQAQLEGVYDSVAALLNAERDEIALVENATVGWQMAFYALAFRPGDRILTGRAEYAANYVAYLQTARRYGVAIEVIPNDAWGATDPRALRQMIDDRVRLIALTWVPTNGGLVNPAAEIGKIAREAAIPYLLDACQAAGQMSIDVQALGCDMLTATGRKFLRGPRGTGFLYVRRNLLLKLEPPMIDHFAAPWTSLDGYTLRPDARRFETWESNYAARLGLGVAVDYALAVGMAPIEARCRALAKRLREGLRSLFNATVLDLGRDGCAIVSFSLHNDPVEAVLADAAAANIVIGASPPPARSLIPRRGAWGTCFGPRRITSTPKPRSIGSSSFAPPARAKGGPERLRKRGASRECRLTREEVVGASLATAGDSHKTIAAPCLNRGFKNLELLNVWRGPKA